MPWKLVSFLSILIVVTLFIGFNLDNRCDVSLIVYTFHNVPIFVSLLAAYVVGSITVIPFFLAGRSKHSRDVTRRSGSSGGKGSSGKKRSRKAVDDDLPFGMTDRDYDID